MANEVVWNYAIAAGRRCDKKVIVEPNLVVVCCGEDGHCSPCRGWYFQKLVEFSAPCTLVVGIDGMTKRCILPQTHTTRHQFTLRDPDAFPS